jgi:hypothetical protein
MIDSAAGEINAAPSPRQGARADEHALASGETVEQRRAGEDSEPDQEQPLQAEEVAEAAAQQEEAAEDEGVGVDDPLQAAVGEVKVVLDRRQGDVHDRRVENDHEVCQADEDEDDPGICRGGSQQARADRGAAGGARRSDRGRPRRRTGRPPPAGRRSVPTAAFEVLERQDRGLSKAPTTEEIAAAIDPIISFVRAGLQAFPNRTASRGSARTEAHLRPHAWRGRSL